MDITVQIRKELAENIINFQIAYIGEKILLGLYAGKMMLAEIYLLNEEHIPEFREAISLEFWACPEMWAASIN